MPRDEILVTTKLWNDDQQNVRQAMETSLKKLQLERVDLYLTHWQGVFDQNIIRQLAKKYGKTAAQIVICWNLDSGLVVISKSVTPARIEENFAVLDFRLEKIELSEIAKLDRGNRLGQDPETFN